MAIRITTSPEPLSRNSFRTGPVVIASDASRLLTQELRRYCAGDVNGRSFLISGHRGAGKTTLVSGAFMTALLESERNPQQMLRPLFVPLHGPNLLPDPRRARLAQSSRGATIDDKSDDKNKVEGARQRGSGDAASTKTEPSARALARDDSDPEMQAALVQITLSLHRAVCREIVEHYRNRLIRRQDYRDSDRQPVFDASYELAAQLELELYQWPTAMRLREFWERAGVLRTGVLRYEGGPDQGLQELVALAAVCDSYRRISGTLSQTEKGSESGSQTATASIDVNAGGKDFFGPLISLLTGGAVGTGLSVAGLPATAATFAGAIGALASALTLKGSASRTRTRSRSREDNFLFDLSVATLDRVLPVLVQSLLRCGLAPIFVVDELDKVVGLQDRMVGMVHHLKKLVAESAFFCFLTDRLYFEQLRVLNQNEAFPSEYTYFTHRVFVVFRASDMHKYLFDHVLDGQSLNRRPGSSLPGATPGSPSTSTQQDDVDRELLPYMVLHRARMHPIDVLREIALLRDEEGSVPPARVRSSASGFDLLIQLAIETVMRGPKFADELDREPAFYRVAYDAMYYLSRLWEDAKTVDVRDENRDAFDKYLDDRVGRDTGEVTRADTTSTWFQSSSSDPKGGRLRIPDQQKRFLFERVQELASLLAYPDVFKGYLNPAIVAVPVLDRASDLLRLDPPLLEITSERVFEWCYDPAGKRLRPSKGGDRNHLWKQDAEQIESLDKEIRAVLGPTIGLVALSTQYGVLPTSPPWTAVDQALVRLKKFRDLEYLEREEDHRNVGGYAMMLERNAVTIGRSLQCVAALSAVGDHPAPPGQYVAALGIVSEWYRLRFKLEEQVSAAVSSCWSQLAERYRLTSADAAPFDKVDKLLDGAALSKTLSLEQIVKEMKARPTDVLAQVDLAWESVAKRVSGQGVSEPDLSELICAAFASLGPAKYSSFVTPLTVAEWSTVFEESLRDVDNSPSFVVPTWFAPIALARLGFQPASSRVTFTAPLAEQTAFSVRKPSKAPKGLQTVMLGQPSEVASLIVKADGQSLVDRLPSTRSIAAVVLTQKQLEQRALRGYLEKVQAAMRTPLFQQLVIEMPADPKKVEELAAAFLIPPSTGPQPTAGRTIFLYSSTPPEGSPAPQLIAPTSLDQILPATAA